jgi:predicted nucleic acid-binding protein
VKEYVFDANALVCLYRNTPGADDVDRLIRQSKAGLANLAISAVNLAEVFYVLARYLGVERAVQCVREIRNAVRVVSAEEDCALEAAVLRLHYKLGLADCFAAELAMRTGATLVTADPEFARLGKQLKVLALPRHSR